MEGAAGRPLHVLHFFRRRSRFFLENRGLPLYTNLVIVCNCERGEPYLSKSAGNSGVQVVSR